MREILFRGKMKNSEKWIYGFLIRWLGGSWIVVNHTYTQTNSEVIPESVGQYTGLTDKNGTKIFEGDILKRADTGNIYVIEFYKGVFIGKTKYSRNWILHDSIENYEVIGNIHDNPELLEAQDV